MNLNVFGVPDAQTNAQMTRAMQLPVARAGALMPDAHLGYGLPIGGVLATEGAVVPYAVGVDIACRVKLSVLDLPVESLGDIRLFRDAISSEMIFGSGGAFEGKRRRDHPVMDRDDWDLIPIEKDRAHAQLGTSGGGNHFVDIGVVEYKGATSVGILTHSGSRGAGAATCEKYSRLASNQHPEGGELAWLELGTPAGDDYWRAMNLMGEYASANHACIHEALVSAIGAEVVDGIENHHNFAWIENDLVVHRKGATPAAADELGVVPGTMMHRAHIVRGMGRSDGLNSSAHGAGRLMSRRQAKKTLDPDRWEATLVDAGVTLLGAGLDELPGAYKDIETVMREQDGLAETIGTFRPVIVKMAGTIGAAG